MTGKQTLHPLLCHAQNHAPAVRQVEAGACFASDGAMRITFRLSGDMARLRIPPPQAVTCRDGLWEHTCFEVFLHSGISEAYREYNFSPSGQWAAYAFSAYRTPDRTLFSPSPPCIEARLSAGRLDLDVTLAADSLPRGKPSHPLRIGLSAVIESQDIGDGQLSYWALHHPSPRPDFHQHEGFILALTPP